LFDNSYLIVRETYFGWRQFCFLQNSTTLLQSCWKPKSKKSKIRLVRRQKKNKWVYHLKLISIGQVPTHSLPWNNYWTLHVTAKAGKIKTTNSYLPPASLNHKLPDDMGCWLGLQGPDVDALIKRVSGNNLPVVENWQAESLALGLCPHHRTSFIICVYNVMWIFGKTYKIK